MYDFSPRHGESRTRRRGNRGFDDDAPTTAKRTRRRSLPPVDYTTDGLPEGDRWSTWDQSKILVSNDLPTERGFDGGTGSIRKLKRFIHLVKRQPVSILRFQ